MSPRSPPPLHPLGGCVHCSQCELAVQAPDSGHAGEASHGGQVSCAHSCVCACVWACRGCRQQSQFHILTSSVSRELLSREVVTPSLSLKPDFCLLYALSWL